MKINNRTFNLRLLPMDFARLVSAPIWAFYRMKRVKASGEKYTEKINGGAVVVANHTSMQDPFLVESVFPFRRMFFLAAEAVMGNSKIKAWLLKEAGAIKIDRNAADIEAINRSVEVLQKGKLLAVFPQGSINKDEGISEIKSGAVLIAIRANVPIIPIFITPKKHWYERRKAIIGETLNPKDFMASRFPTMADIESITENLAKRMKELGEMSL